MEGKVVLIVGCPVCKLQTKILVKKGTEKLGRAAWQLKHKKQCPERK